MAYPVDTKGNKIVTLKISRGPNLHSIQDSLCSPSEEWFLRGIDFKILIPYEDGTGQRKQGEVCISLVPTELRRLDIRERFSLACSRPQTFRLGMVNFLKDAPFQITNYSTKSRKGFMEVNAVIYGKFVDMLSDGVCQ